MASTGRIWAGRLAIAVVVPALVLGALELGLRAFGYGTSTHYFVPADAVTKKAEKDVYWTNPRFGWRFFGPELSRPPLPTILSRHKPPGTYRIFLLGGSAARGFPDPAFGFGRILQAMLQDTFPGTRFTVVNTGMTAINSHVVREIARDCARFEPDLFIVYLGNNEVVGPFGAGTIFQGPVRSLASIRAALFVRSLRLGQLLGAIRRRLAPSDAATRHEWGGMQMFLDQSVPADHPRLQNVYRNFEANLRDICATSRRAHAPVILATVVANLKDNRPFASVHRDGFTDEQRSQWEDRMDAADAAREAGRDAQALPLYQEAAALDEGDAEPYYGAGICQLALGRSDAARETLQRALDLDVLRFRADSRINETIREVAREAPGDVHLVDPVAAVAADPRAPGGIAGMEFLYEHVHPNFAGNHLIAATLFPSVVDQLPEAIRAQAAADVRPPDLQRCADLVLFSDFFELAEVERIAIVTSRPPFWRGAARPHLTVARTLLGQLTPQGLQATADRYAQALQRTPDDLLLRGSFAHLQQYRGEFDAARSQYEELLRRYPGDSFWRQRVGEVLLGAGDADAAVAAFGDLLERDPYAFEARTGLAAALRAAGREDEAMAAYEAVLALQPRQAEAHYRIGSILLERGELEAAETELRAATQIDPAHGEAQFYLAKTLDRRGRLEQALAAYERADELIPANAAIQYNAATIYFKLAQVERARRLYQWAIQLDPRFQQNPPYRLSSVINRPDALQGALQQLKRRVQENPDDARVWFHLGLAFDLHDEVALAVEQYRRALERDPDLEEALNRLAWVSATHDDPGLATPEEAVHLAERACELTQREDPSRLDTLAAAYANAGEFERARTTAREALAVAKRTGPTTLVEQIRRRLATYRSDRAFRAGAG